MKHLKLATICLGLALTVMLTTEAEAGKKPSKGTRTEKAEEMKQRARFDNYPAMQFMSGVLTRDAHSGWKIGETPLYVSGKCVITMEGVEEGGWLEEGRNATIMGSKIGEAISAWSIMVSRSEYESRDFKQSSTLREPGANPDVGVILKKVD
jgi:hypothetical protein